MKLYILTGKKHTYACMYTCLAVTRVCSQTAPEQVKKHESRAMDEIRSGTPE